MKYGYARVSTKQQSLSDQVDKLIRAGVPITNIYSEAYTGTTSKRPEFMRLKEKLKGGDELVVTKLDRLGRKTTDIIEFLDSCSRRGITVNVLNMGRLDNSASGRLMSSVVSAFAEYERDAIVSRTQEGKTYAKAHNKNYHEGRPKRTITARYKKIYELSKNHTIRDTAMIAGVSESTVSRIRRQVKNEQEKS